MDFNYYLAGTYEPGYAAVRSLAPIKPSLSPDYALNRKYDLASSSWVVSTQSSWSNPVQENFRKNSSMSGMSGFNGTTNVPKGAAPKELPPIKRLVIPEFRRVS